jgi:hypothetical protein
MASLLNGSLAKVRLLVPGLTFSWHLPGFPLEWEPCCFPCSSSRGETTCPSPNLQLTFAWLPSSMEALLLPWLLFQRWDQCPSPNLQLTFSWLHSWNGSLAASLVPLPEVRPLVPALTYSWHLHGFPLSVYLSKGESVHLFCWRFSCFCHGWREGNGYQALIKPGTAKELNNVANDLKVPKCEIFSSLRFSSFLYHKASMDRWLCDWNKKSKFLLFCENFIFAHAECAPKKLLCLL